MERNAAAREQVKTPINALLLTITMHVLLVPLTQTLHRQSTVILAVKT